MKRLQYLTCLTALLLAAASALAIPAKRGSVKVQQPDGTYITIELHGDEWHHFTTTADGYTVQQDARGYYVYAQQKDGVLQASQQVAHDLADRTAREQAFLASTPKRLQPAMTQQKAQLKQTVLQREAGKRKARRAAQYDYSNFKGLVILIQYKDKKFSRTDYSSIIDNMMNQQNYTGYDNEQYTGSVRDYFNDNSGGRFQPEFDVYGPYDIDYSQYDAQSGNNAALLLTAAVNKADNEIDFSQYDRDDDGVVDMIYFIVAGNGANYSGNDSRLWWPHRSVIYDPTAWEYILKDGVYLYDYASSTELAGYTSQPSTVKIDGIGTICHEFSHVLGLPDFYDTDYEKSGGTSNHPDTWSVMAGGSYENDSRTPVGYSLYERYSVGFTDEPQTISQQGNYTLQPLCNSETGYRIDTPVEGEFFLLENRQQTGFKWDAYLPGSGMLVHRVDFTNEGVWSMSGNSANKVNANPAHNYYEVVRAGGAHQYGGYYYSTEADVFPGSNGVHQLSNTTAPASLKTWNGTENQFSIDNIQQLPNGNITFTVNGYELTAITLPETLNLGIGISQQLEVTATPSAAVYTLTWASSNEAVASVDANGTVRGLTEGTTVVTATANNGLQASCTVTVVTVPALNFAAFKQQPVGENVLLKLENAEVLFVYSKDGHQTAFLRDATGALMVYDANLNIEAGNIANGTIAVKTAVVNNVPQAVGLDGEDYSEAIAVTTGDVQPREVSFEELTEADYSDWVCIKRASIIRSQGYWVYKGTQRARLWAGTFGIATGLKTSTKLVDKYFDVEAIYGTDVLNGQIINELNVTKAVEESPIPSGIQHVATPAADSAPCYNLAGQRVNSSYQGLVIVNGKKIKR